MTKLIFRLKGGQGSGHFGHAGRPGEEGGSLPGKGTRGGEYTQEALDFKRAVRSAGIPVTMQPGRYGKYHSGGGSSGIGPGSGPQNEYISLNSTGRKLMEFVSTGTGPFKYYTDKARDALRFGEVDYFVLKDILEVLAGYGEWG